VQQPKVAGTDYNVGCEYDNPLVALFEDKDTQDSINELDSAFDGYRFSLPESLNPFFDREHLQKKTKISHYTAEIVVETLDKHGKLVPIRALVDTCASSSIVLSEFVKKVCAGGYKGHPTNWETMGGNFTTKKKALLYFKFPELDNDSKVTWVFHVDEQKDRQASLYDMIIGLDLQTAIGIHVNTEEKVIQWGSNMIPLGTRGVLNEENTLQEI